MLSKGAAGARGGGWWLAKADAERGGRRPKKGLLRGGKNRKEEGYIPSDIKGSGGGRGGERGWWIMARWSESEETHGGSAAFVAL